MRCRRPASWSWGASPARPSASSDAPALRAHRARVADEALVAEGAAGIGRGGFFVEAKGRRRHSPILSGARGLRRNFAERGSGRKVIGIELTCDRPRFIKYATFL